MEGREWRRALVEAGFEVLTSVLVGECAGEPRKRSPPVSSPTGSSSRRTWLSSP